VIRRYLIYKGYEVTYVSNFTDIDDKMINRAEMMKISVKELPTGSFPNTRKIISFGILFLMPAEGHRICTPNDRYHQKAGKERSDLCFGRRVYFDIRIPAYGKLSKQDLDALKSGIRVEVKVSKKIRRISFCGSFQPGNRNGKARGKGQPGWHMNAAR